ncbi:glycosyltransferase [Acetobacteraceae bacterium KSS8]|uniref:Glycosyltransferase n=1 Tax=Endosaccharibacter trunci TaxID=2812733 RepID=A0ABT1WBL5_9PROT|nr:glycosyltransferase [Acetobacteraceae bacterium KSS8]
MLALAVLTLLIWCWLILFHGRFWQAGPVLRPVPADPDASWPPVQIVIPARDEAEGVAACLRSLLAQDYPARYRIVLVDDRSTDGTGALARAVGEGSARLLVVDGAEPPESWSGKLWAVNQGVAAALADLPEAHGYLLLCDADIIHAPAHLTTLVAKAERERLDQVSEMVELSTVSMAERALVPAFVFFFQLLYPFARVNDPRSRTAAAAGGTVLIRKDALARIGGIESLRGALIDDVTLATRVKRAGGRIWLGHSMLARSVRPYPGAADVWRMVARTAYVQLRFSPLLLLGTVIGMVLVWLAPVLCLVFGHGLARWFGLGAWVLSTGSFLPTLRRFRLSPLWALLLPLIGLFYTGATIGSAIDHHRGRGVVWKSRAYRDREKGRTVA